MKRLIRKLVLIAITIVACWTANAQESFADLQKKGNSELIAKNYNEAIAFFDKALKLGTDDKEQMVWVSLIAASCAQELNDKPLVLAFYRTAFRNGSNETAEYDFALDLARELKDFEAQEEILKTGRNSISEYYTKYTLKLFYLYYNNKKFDKVPALAKEILVLKPDDKKVTAMMAVAYMNNGDTKVAEEIFLSILDGDSLDLVSNRQLGLIYYNRGQQLYNDANKEYEALSSPTRVDYANYLKQIKKSYPVYAKAATFLERAYHIKQDPAVRQVLFNLYTRTENSAKASEFR